MRQTIGGSIDSHALALLSGATGQRMSEAKETQHKAKGHTDSGAQSESQGRGAYDLHKAAEGPTPRGKQTCTRPNIQPGIKDSNHERC